MSKHRHELKVLLGNYRMLYPSSESVIEEYDGFYSSVIRTALAVSLIPVQQKIVINHPALLW